jgi:FkbM family methyltransferase
MFTQLIKRNSSLSVVAIIFAGLLTILLVARFHDFTNPFNSAPASKPKRKFIFIDFGANRGDSWESFLNPSLTTANKAFSIPQGRSPTDFEAYLFEANPIFDEPLKKAAEANPKVHSFYSHAVTTKDGPIVFWLDVVNPQHNYWGSSLNKDNPNVNQKKEKVTVPGVDAAKFIKSIATPYDYVIVKMDVEGEEWNVIPHFVEQGIGQYIDELYVEFHNYMSGLGDDEANAKKAELVGALQEDGVIFPADYDSNS